ncbi:MAG: EscU/YscU/HrcU family type III secretion system export apparatus switch protein [Pirellulaceae bacterium]|nr:EscU/YscU/HrcU family type III secretion system export apparatus switch protein [Pirellulaceae bacterium]
MSDEQGERRHAPTPHRRQEAWQRGQVPRSHELVAAGLLFGGLLLVSWLGQGVADFLAELAAAQWGRGVSLRIDSDQFVEQTRGLLLRLISALLPLLGLLAALAVLVNLGQTGWRFSPDRLAWDVSRLSPLGGLRRIFSADSGVRLALGLLKLAAVALVAGWSVWSQRERVVGLASLDAPALVFVLLQLACGVCLRVSGVLLVLAAGDYAWQWWQHERSLWMSDEELREELRSLQGDPQVAAQRRGLLARRISEPSRL